MELIYSDDRIVVCIKPSGIRSTDEPGGLPDLVREALGDGNAVLHTVHRLDQAVSGVMVLARTARAAADLSAEIRDGSFEKEYLAVVHGHPQERDTLRDLLWRDKALRKTFVAQKPGKDVQEAALEYETVGSNDKLTMVRIRLHTGRTHQIRVQFASCGYPLVGDGKYGLPEDDCPIALWSCRLSFCHPRTKERLEFTKEPPARFPWTEI